MLILCLPYCCEFIICTSLSVVIVKLKHSLTVRTSKEWTEDEQLEEISACRTKIHSKACLAWEWVLAVWKINQACSKCLEPSPLLSGIFCSASWTFTSLTTETHVSWEKIRAISWNNGHLNNKQWRPFALGCQYYCFIGAPPQQIRVSFLSQSLKVFAFTFYDVSILLLSSGINSFICIARYEKCVRSLH